MSFKLLNGISSNRSHSFTSNKEVSFNAPLSWSAKLKFIFILLFLSINVLLVTIHFLLIRINFLINLIN